MDSDADDSCTSCTRDQRPALPDSGTRDSALTTVNSRLETIRTQAQRHDTNEPVDERRSEAAKELDKQPPLPQWKPDQVGEGFGIRGRTP